LTLKKLKKKPMYAWQIATIDCNTHSVAATSGMRRSPKPLLSGDAPSIVPAHCHGHQNEQEMWYLLLIVALFAVTLVAAGGAIGSKSLSPNGSVQWLPIWPWASSIGRRRMNRFNASTWPPKWPAMEVHLFVAAAVLLGVIVAKDHVMVH
jgi:hypothetical protein